MVTRPRAMDGSGDWSVIVPPEMLLAKSMSSGPFAIGSLFTCPITSRNEPGPLSLKLVTVKEKGSAGRDNRPAVGQGRLKGELSRVVQAPR